MDNPSAHLARDLLLDSAKDGNKFLLAIIDSHEFDEISYPSNRFQRSRRMQSVYELSANYS